MDFEKLCRILKTGKQDSQNYELPDELTKLSEAELLEFLKNNEKEIINGVIDTFSKCGIKITANNNKVIIKSPGYYTVTNDVETGEQTKAEAEAEAEAEPEPEPEAEPEAETQTIPEAKPKPKTKPGFGSSVPRFRTNNSRVTGGKKFIGRNITKKNRANLTHLKKNICGMVMNGGSGIVIECFYYLCVSICLVVSSPFFIIHWTYKAIYKHFNNYAGKPIYTAVKMNDLKKLNALLANLTDENKEILNKDFIDEDRDFYYDEDGHFIYHKPLFVAVQNRDTEIVKALIEAGADVNATSYYGRTPLFDAIKNHNTEIVKALIEAGADVNATYNYGRTPLFDAIKNRNTEIVKALIKAGADVNATYNYGRTPLFDAVAFSKSGNIEIVKALLEYGADVYARPINDRYSPILEAKNAVIKAARLNNQFWQENSTKIVKLLETYGQRNTTLLLTEGVLQDLKVAHELDASTEEDLYDYLGPDPSSSLRNAKREKSLENIRKNRQEKLSSMSAEELKDLKELERVEKERQEKLSRVANDYDDDNHTPGGKNSRSKTRKQKRRKTKK